MLKEAGLECESVNKVTEGRPHIVDRLKNGEIHLIVNTTEGKQAQYDSAMIRRAAYKAKCITQRLSMAQKLFAKPLL